MLRTTMRSARTWRWAKTRRWVGQFSGPASLSPSRSCLGYTTITSGYDFRKAQRAKTRHPRKCVGNPREPYAPSRERARFGSEFISALLRDFQQGGPVAIAKVRKYQPAAYMKICALMIPKEVKLEHSGSVIKAMTDEELDMALEALRDLLARREAAAANVIEGTAEPVVLP